MIDKSTIESLSQGPAIDAADRATSCALPEVAGVLALPDNFQTHDLEKLLPNRRRLRGSMATTNLDHFGEYIEAHKEAGATVFVNDDNMTATAVLNLGDPTAPGHADNTASYKPQKTAEYTALLAIANGLPKSQREFAEYLEDWASNIECWNGDTALVAKHAIAAVRKVTIEAISRSESTKENLSESRSAFDQVKATSGENPLPSSIVVGMDATYGGFNGRVITVRVSVLTSQKDPQFVLRIIKAEQLADDLAEELADRVGLAVKVPVVIGTYSRA